MQVRRFRVQHTPGYQGANAQCIDNVHYFLALLFYSQALITKLMEQLKVSKIIIDFLICFVLKQVNKNSGFITIACVCESASTITKNFFFGLVDQSVIPIMIE